MRSYLSGKVMPEIKILVVEDDTIASMDVQASLERIGYKVAATALTGEDAVRLCGELDPDLVLMDVRLEGEMDGVEAAEQITELYGTPIIYLTIFSDNETLSRAKVSGPYGFLLKPVDERDLRSAIEVALYKHKMERELRQARKETEAANAVKTSFLATISHELRTPMNGVLGMTELLLLSDLPEEHKSNVELIKESAMSLLNVLNQILDYSKLEARIQALRETEFRIRELLESVVTQYEGPARAKGIELGFSMDPNVPELVLGDSGKLRQVVKNVVENAVKFTSEGRIDVEARLAHPSEYRGEQPAEDRVRLHVAVRDTGCGIPPEKLGGIFECFTQVDDYMTRKEGGLGLGLAISSRLATLLGGEIWTESEEGKGSVFHITADLQPQDVVEAESDSGTGSLRGLSILIADDDLISKTYFSRILEKHGCSVEAVDDGSKAVRRLAEEDYDLVLMDIQMPEMDGIEATRIIRAGKGGVRKPSIPIVALTAHAMWGDEQRCLHAGMDNYLAKPADIDTLSSVIRATLDGGEESGHVE